MISYADRVLQTSTTAGTGTYALIAPPSGFRSFVAGVGSGKKVTYHVDDGTDWESGVGTITAGSPDTLSRDVVLESSNGNAAVNWGGGTKNVRLIYPAKRSVSKDENGNCLEGADGTVGGTGNAHTLAQGIPCAALSDGMRVRYRAPADNTGAITLNVDGKGAKTLRFSGFDFASGAVKSGDLIDAIYRASANSFEVQRDPAVLSDAQITIASAATTSIAAQASKNILISGTTGITSFGNSGRIGNLYDVRFTGALNITHNATSLILPRGKNITTAAGDTALVEDLGSNNWRVRRFDRANKVESYIKLNGTGTPAAISSSNVSSITDNGVGDYTINFTTAFPNADYIMSGTANFTAGNAWVGIFSQTASSIRVRVANNNAFADLDNIHLTFREAD